MQSFSDIIDKFGTAHLAALWGLDESHVRTMKARDSIPAEYWGSLIEDAPKQAIMGITWKILKSLRDSRFATKPRERAAS